MTEFGTEDSPTQVDVLRRRERILLVVLALFSIAVIGWGFATVPSEDELVETARTADETVERVRALNALALRGYWDARPLEELGAFLDDSPPELREFMRTMHPTMLRQR